MHASHPLEAFDDAVGAAFTLRTGEEAWMDVVWRPSYAPKDQTLDPQGHAREGARRLEATIAFWRAWLGRCAYQGIHADAVRRSALALKAMIYAPSGAIAIVMK